ncbi:MAG: hypothetical protein ABEK84_00080 [Salinibacter sp.]
MTRLLTSLNRLQDVLSPLVDQWRTLMNGLEAVAPYAEWCLGCAVGIALLSLAGFALFAPLDQSNRERDLPPRLVNDA